MIKRDLIRLLRVFNIFCATFACPAVLFASVPESLPAQSAGMYGYLYLGDNTGGSSSGELETVNYKGGGPYEWGLGVGRYLTETVSLEGTLEYWGERYERQSGTVIPGTENNIIQAGGLGLSISAIYNFTHKRIHSYAGVGVGYFLTGILVTEPGTGLLTDGGAPSDKFLLGYHTSVGVDFQIEGNHKLGLEVKYRILKADFGQYTNGKVDLGGTYILLMYRHSSR